MLGHLTLFLAPLLTITQAAFAADVPNHVADYSSPSWQKASLYERIETASKALVGTPYLLGNLGEGADGIYDRDPLFRFDVFDCTTFVETVLSVARSNQDSDFLPAMLAIRYDRAQVGFVSRNHFPEQDWIPNNIREGFFSDATAPVQARFGLPTAVATIDKRGWYRKMTIDAIQGPFSIPDRVALLPHLQAEGQGFEPVVNRLPYIPFTMILSPSGDSLNAEIVDALPEYGVANMVRPGWDLVAAAGTQLNISHQVLWFKRGQDVVIRHATPSTGDENKRVIEERLVDYIRRNSGIPTLKGLHVLKILD